MNTDWYCPPDPNRSPTWRTDKRFHAVRITDGKQSGMRAVWDSSPAEMMLLVHDDLPLLDLIETVLELNKADTEWVGPEPLPLPGADKWTRIRDISPMTWQPL